MVERPRVPHRLHHILQAMHRSSRSGATKWERTTELTMEADAPNKMIRELVLALDRSAYIYNMPARRLHCLPPTKQKESQATSTKTPTSCIDRDWSRSPTTSILYFSHHPTSKQTCRPFPPEIFIAIVALVSAFPPSVAALCHMIKHLRPKNRSDQTGMHY